VFAFFLYKFSFTVWYIIVMSCNRNDYADTSCPDAPVPPYFSIPRCEHHKEAHVKQSKHSSTTGRAYYCCPYKSVSNKISHVWILWNLTLTSFFPCRSSTVVDSFSWLMGPSWSIDKFFFSRMIGMSLLRYGLSNIGFLSHQIHHQWQIRRRAKQVTIVSTTHLRANMATVLSWWIHLQGWITHCFSVVRLLYQ
jgi:hypothetical protein